jgi:hypothetical protein
MGAALLLFDFDYGDMVRCLGREYTNQGRNWKVMSDPFETLREKPQLPGYPSLDFDRAVRCNMEGVPLQGNFECNLDDQRTRATPNNHGPVREYKKDVRKKFATEEAKLFHIAFPRFLTFFKLGLFINPISWVIQKGKGWICIDSSTKIGNNPTGSPNHQIPKAGSAETTTRFPPLFYGTAIKCH